MKLGTIVMLRSPLPLTVSIHAIENGAVGEVVPPRGLVEAGNVVVDFPQYPSFARTKLWESPVSWLIPLSDPDLNVGDVESDSEYLKKPVEDLV